MTDEKGYDHPANDFFKLIYQFSIESYQFYSHNITQPLLGLSFFVLFLKGKWEVIPGHTGCAWSNHPVAMAREAAGWTGSVWPAPTCPLVGVVVGIEYPCPTL